MTMPKHGWTCFHCGETFTRPGPARDHFGVDPDARPGCLIKAGEERGLLMALRRAEAELADWRAEVHAEQQTYPAIQAAHVVALRDAKQKGYDRGLADGRTLVDEIDPVPSQGNGL